ncbi:GNAT family N-acetyltransferase [Corynebacterium urinipleomorphum]|uniref:GNAT family N-acetyltransferase n=1 Tax=Corynebacterium urinipleomorphum TaxID=1852380 RepID=UPI000B35C1F1|nr:GNAT family N-acetyltransferase [Corynebacterium urinipleomorphum]
MPERTPIRRACPPDAATVARLLRDFNTEFETSVPDAETLTQRWETLLGRDDVVVLLADDDAGFAFLTLRPTPYWDGPLAQLEELYIVPELRGRGIGSALIAGAVEESRRRGAQEMLINADEIDHGACRFYERHGFSNYELGQDYRMLCYIRELGP